MLATVRYALRSLRRSPAFAVTVVATLALGIGLNAAIFAVVDCVLLRPLGYRDADRIVSVRTHFVREGRSIPSIGGDDYNDLARDVKGLEATAFYESGADGVALHGVSLYVPVADVSPRFAEVLGVQPVAGRLLHSSDRQGTDALVSAAFAREHFDSASAAVGQPLTYEGSVYTVVGVLPDGFGFPGKTQAWFEMAASPQTSNRTAYNQHAVARRRVGVSEGQLAAELKSFSQHLQRAYPEDRAKTLEAVALQEQIVGSIRPLLRLLMGSVLVIVLIVCANLTHLQLVRATRELRGITIRTALGATRRSLATRALAEAGLLAAAGSGLAVLLAEPALRVLVRLAPPNIPRLAEVRLNGDVLLFSFLLAFAVMAVTALLPLWRSWQIDPASALRQDASRGTESRGTVRLRSGFLVAEIALTLMLSVSAVLLARQLAAQAKVDLGFAADHLVTLDAHAILQVAAPVSTDGSPAGIAAREAAREPIIAGKLARLEDTLSTIRAVPGVESAAAIRGAPMGFFGSDVSYAVKGRQVFAAATQNMPDADIRPVTPGFFSTMRIPLLRGRGLAESDRQGAPPVLLINQELARQVFPGQDPLGQQIMCGFDTVGQWWTIVGVVGDIHNGSPGERPSPMMYVPVAQHRGGASDVQLVVRTASDPSAMVETLRRVLLRSHPEVAIQGSTMTDNIGEVGRSDHFRTLLFSGFAAVSLLLAAVGMYGVTAYTVTQRRFEFGLRIALGAERGQVLGMVLRGAVWTAGIGVVTGILLSLGLARVLSSVVGSLPVFDGVSYAVAAGGVLVISVLATVLPARRASAVDPMTVLRSE